MQELLKLMAQLMDDLVALGSILPGVVPRKLLARPADGETLIIEQAANLAHHEDIMPLIVAAVSAPLDGAKLGEFLFPITQHMGFDPAELADFADSEIAFAWDWR